MEMTRAGKTGQKITMAVPSVNSPMPKSMPNFRPRRSATRGGKRTDSAHQAAGSESVGHGDEVHTHAARQNSQEGIDHSVQSIYNGAGDC